MKNIKRFICVLLALVMAFAMAIPTFAEQEETLPGSITINDAVPGQTYKVYRILDLESYDATKNAYAYKANSAWEDWLKTQTSYVKIDEQGYVTWVGDADAADFAKAAQAHAADSNITPDKTETASAAEEGKTYSSVSFKNLKLGYYLVDTTLGTLCSLGTTNPNVVMEEKNEVPVNVKTVEEDSKVGQEDSYSNKNDADIGQTVKFKSTITAQAGAENYVFHDKMSDGLTYGSVTSITLNGTKVDSSDYTIVPKSAEGDETEENGLDDNCTFEVRFSKEFCDALKANDKIEISYTATVNENAIIGDAGNKNESKLSYGEEGKSSTIPSETTTKTWSVTILKYTNAVTAADNSTSTENVGTGDTVTPTPIPTPIPLAGAKFTLSRNENGSSPISLIEEKDNEYRVAKTGEDGTVTEITTDATGKFTIAGLDSDTYYLTEIEAPKGYNKLDAPITVVIDENGKTKVGDTVVNEVEVLNNTGPELPSTGGIGTTIFYIIGGILVVGAGVLLVAKRRMKSEE